MFSNIVFIARLMIVTLSLGLVACSNPINKPHVTVEYEQPYVLSPTHQALPVGVTQKQLTPRSDVAIIESDYEYVYWTSDHARLEMGSNSTVPSSFDTQDFEEQSNTSSIKVQTPDYIESDDIVKATVKASSSVNCKKIYCDIDKENECGAIAWCDDGLCEKDKKLAQFYDCTGDSCVAKFVNDSLLSSADCSLPHMSIHPMCLGKGEPECVNHPELFYCNNLAKQCED